MGKNPDFQGSWKTQSWSNDWGYPHVWISLHLSLEIPRTIRLSLDMANVLSNSGFTGGQILAASCVHHDVFQPKSPASFVRSFSNQDLHRCLRRFFFKNKGWLVIRTKGSRDACFFVELVYWLVVYLPLWKIWVNWDDYSLHIWENNPVMFQTTNQV